MSALSADEFEQICQKYLNSRVEVVPGASRNMYYMTYLKLCLNKVPKLRVLDNGDAIQIKKSTSVDTKKLLDMEQQRHCWNILTVFAFFVQELDAHTSSYVRIVQSLNASRKLDTVGADKLDKMIADSEEPSVSSWDAQFAAHTRTNKYCLE